MDEKELFAIIEKVESDLKVCIDSLKTRIRDSEKDITALREYQLNCPVKTQANNLEKAVEGIKGRMFWNTIMISIFLSISGGLASLHIFPQADEIKPKDVLEYVKGIEEKLRREIRENRRILENSVYNPKDSLLDRYWQENGK